MSYRLQILHGSSYGQSQQITQNKFCNYIITKLRNYVIIIELKVWTPLSLLYFVLYLNKHPLYKDLHTTLLVCYILFERERGFIFEVMEYLRHIELKHKSSLLTINKHANN